MTYEYDLHESKEEGRAEGLVEGEAKGEVKGLSEGIDIFESLGVSQDILEKAKQIAAEKVKSSQK